MFRHIGAQPILRQFCSGLWIAVLDIGPVSAREPISRCRQHSGFKDRDVEWCSKILRKKEQRRFARCRESTEGVDGDRVGNTHDGFDGAGVISPDDVVATIGAGITNVFSSANTASPIHLLRSATAAACRHTAAAAPEVEHRASHLWSEAPETRKCG